ncbi:MAG: hypothetical protein ACTSQ4_00225 [Candidatus Heimdallarchaeaceae archaeon]
MIKVWGYTPSATLPSPKILGAGIEEVKQVFSALLFRDGVKGVCVQIEKIEGHPKAIIQLFIDDTVVLTTNFSPTESKDFCYEIEETINPKIKIEVVFKVEQGSISLPVSAIGSGMGFQKINNDFVPMNHLGLGLIIP